MAVFVRMVFGDFATKEDLLKFIPLKGHTTGQELYSHLKHIISSEKIPISKVVGLTTDGATAMVGCDKGQVAFCRKDESLPQFLCYHCIIHQQALCGSFLKLNNVMKLEIKIVNKTRAQSLERRLFKSLADKIDYQYRELLLHSDHDAKHFPILSEKISEKPMEKPYGSKYHVEIVSNLKVNFKNRFKDFNEMTLVAQFVVSPFMEIDIQQFATSVMQSFGEDIVATEMELIAF
ncbi:hypothetical protein QE152_g39484 [Popillia japonica]|uniref:Uncharacterized protein n=1 Tax=Popillia japonica TaxID=7064 RepID=A0AAW1HTL5_POPJA